MKLYYHIEDCGDGSSKTTFYGSKVEAEKAGDAIDESLDNVGYVWIDTEDNTFRRWNKEKNDWEWIPIEDV